MTIAQPPPREAASAAFAKHAWREAYDRYAEADKGGALSPRDLVKGIATPVEVLAVAWK